MGADEFWFRQDYRWTRAYAVHWKGWAASLLFIVLFFGLVGFFIFGLGAVDPINYGLLALLWLLVLAMMGVAHLFARSRTDRRWQKRDRN